MQNKSMPATGSSRLQRMEEYLSSHTILILVVLCIFTWFEGLFALKASPITFHSGETVSWWGIVLNFIHGYGYSLCNQYYFPFCSDTNMLTAMREPAPVFLFAGVAMLFKESLYVAAITELILDIGIVVATFFLTREWTRSTLASLLAALIWAIYPRAIILISQVSGDLLAGLSVTIGILFVMRARRTDQTRDWLIAGICLGIAVMSRSAMLVIPAMIVIGSAIERWKMKLRFRPALTLFLAVIAIMTPWLIRTNLAFGRPLPGSSLVGYNIYRHNYMLGTNNYLHYVGNDEGWQAIQALIARRTDLRGTENEVQMNAVYQQEGLKIIAANPVHYVLLSAYRFLMLWFDWQVSVGFGYPMGFTEYALAALQAVLIILALIGLRGNVRLTWPLWGSLIAITAAYIAVDSRMLYTGPVMPLLMSLSAAGMVRIGRKLAARKF